MTGRVSGGCCAELGKRPVERVPCVTDARSDPRGLPHVTVNIGKCTCKNVSVVDYALVSSDLFPLISDFAVLDFCELYSDVHCPIFLKLNLIEAQETERGHFESDDDDCLEDADERNLQFITGKPVWCKTREDEYISALDDAVIN